MTDDGGSSGRLRREFDVLPPGDIRNCMVALSEDEALLSRLFQYRFQSGRGLKGHSFGNLFLTALTHITGDFAGGGEGCPRKCSRIAGRIYPATAANVSLEATLANGTQRRRRNAHQPQPRTRSDRIRLKPTQLQAAAGDAGGHRRGRPDHAGPGLAVHQRDSEPAGGRDPGGDPQLAGASRRTSST